MTANFSSNTCFTQLTTARLFQAVCFGLSARTTVWRMGNGCKEIGYKLPRPVLQSIRAAPRLLYAPQPDAAQGLLNAAASQQSASPTPQELLPALPPACSPATPGPCTRDAGKQHGLTNETKPVAKTWGFAMAYSKQWDLLQCTTPAGEILGKLHASRLESSNTLKKKSKSKRASSLE